MNEPFSETIHVLGFGTAGLSSMKSYRSVMNLLNAAYRQGIRHFDTAPLYGQGYSEKMLGDFAKAKRSELTIATKFGLGNAGPIRIPPALALPLNYYRKKWKKADRGRNHAPTAPKSTELPFRLIKKQDVKNSLEGSLRRLQTQYIDYYFLHEALPSFLEPGVLEFLLHEKQKGTIRNIGVATGAINLANNNSTDFQDWDLLQYEAGEWHEKLKKRFPDKLHFLHSALKNIGIYNEDTRIPANERGGYILAQQSRINQSGKLLFSTRRKTILHDNLNAFRKYSS